jgi:hypothetical protein
MSVSALNGIIYSWERRESRAAVLRALNAVCDEGSTAAKAGNSPPPQPVAGRAADGDDLNYLFTVARNTKLAGDAMVLTAVARALRVLLRLPRNAGQRSEAAVRAATSLLDSGVRAREPAALTEAAYMLLQCVSDPENLVAAFDAVPHTCAALNIADTELQLVGCACLQALCALPMARETVATCGGAETLLALLFSAESDAVVERTLAALHSATADLSVTRCIADHGGVHVIAVMLRDAPTEQARFHATGVMQNLSRDRDIVQLLVSADALGCLMPVIAETSDCETQAAAVGAILNMHQGGPPETRAALRGLLSAVIAESFLTTAMADV